ncbi:hypothetical protein [Georgenia sp. SUBG003]|uniref:hypothetical protein n=1 Tax=Georgenia sp. SUBG003 TaxID=1497974 RepID=UPI003AB745D4
MALLYQSADPLAPPSLGSSMRIVADPQPYWAATAATRSRSDPATAAGEMSVEAPACAPPGRPASAGWGAAPPCSWSRTAPASRASSASLARSASLASSARRPSSARLAASAALRASSASLACSASQAAVAART